MSYEAVRAQYASARLNSRPHELTLSNNNSILIFTFLFSSVNAKYDTDSFSKNHKYNARAINYHQR